MLRNGVRYLYAPAVLVAFNGAAIWIISVAGDHVAIWLAPLLLAAVGTSFLVERWIPYAHEWNDGQGELKRDIAHAFASQGFTIFAILLIPSAAHLRPWSGLWPHAWPIWAQALIAILAADAGITLAHYLFHRSRKLWPFHAAHHLPGRLYGLNGMIRHPVQQALEIGMGSMPLVMMGLPEKVAFLLGFAAAIQVLLQHTNADIRLGPLRYLLAIGTVHRRHHRRSFEGVGVNFGLFTNIWDHLLGVADCRAGEEVGAAEVGMNGAESYPKTFVAQITHPFVRRRATASEVSGEISS